MGANTFAERATGKSPKEAFIAARERAQYDHGHSGYSGTIAEKQDFVLIDLPAGIDADTYANQLIMAGDPRIDDKWGPAGCIACGKGSFLFFGWASS
jgi:hypothetical protein